MTEGQKLKLVRSALKMSQHELSRKLGTSQAIISACELDKQPVSRKLLDNLQQKYSLNLDWFINTRGEMFGKAIPLTALEGDDKDEIIRLLKDQIIQLHHRLADKDRIIKLMEEKDRSLYSTDEK